MLSKDKILRIYRFLYRGMRDVKEVSLDNFASQLLDFMDSFDVISEVESKIDIIPKLYDKPLLPKLNKSKVHDKLSLYNMFKSRYPYVDDSIAKYNLLDLEVKKLYLNSSLFSELLNTMSLGHYDMVRNNIYLTDIEDLDTLFHELMHAFSTLFRNGIFYSGFSQFNDETSEDNFVAFNEAYTLIMEKRRNSNKINVNDENFNFMKSALILEAIIGLNDMAKLYFTLDMKGIVDRVGTLISNEEFLRYLRVFDCVYILNCSNIFNEELCNNFIHVLSEELQDYERDIIGTYEDTNHKKLILNI